MKNLRHFFVKKFKTLVLDALFLLGMVLVCYGAYQIFIPSAYIIGGVLLMVVSASVSGEVDEE